VYPAAVLIQSRRPDAARRFLLFLRSPQAAEVFRRYGFSPLAP
jgi:ABC-type molybdate transport system substrate-binding protein